MTAPVEEPRLGLHQTRYRLHGPLGRGGMSTVFRATDTALEREVAVKLFAARADDPEQLRAQQREAQLLASFRHHSLVRLYDAGVDFEADGTPRMFLVMELVDGPDLRTRLRSGPMTLLHVAHLGFDLSDAVAYLHERGVTHRDLKPANVLLVEWAESRRPRVKLADFGIAQIGEPEHEPEATTGTAAYLSPEQAAGDPAGPAGDVYSLGLLLLEAITGRVAFPGDVLTSAFARLDRDPDLPASLPTAWHDLLSAMTARRPADRPTAVETAVAFRQIIVDEIATTTADPVRSVSRTAAVRRYSLLAAEDDPALDNLSALAKRLLGADAAAIGVHDDDRAVVASTAGIPGAPRLVDGALEQEPLVVEDLRAVAAPPPLAALRPGARGYTSAPATTHDGHAVATVAVLFDDPHAPTAAEAATLQDLADAVLHEAEMRRAVRRLLVPGR